MENRYKEIRIWDLPGKEFSVKLNGEHLSELVKLAKKRYGNLIKVVSELQRRCKSYQNLTPESAYMNMLACLKKEFYLDLDCFIELVKMTKGNLEEAEKQVELLACKYIKKPIKINFPIKFDEDFAFISEAIRTEGHLPKNLRRMEISNTDTRILRVFMDALIRKFGVKPDEIKLCLYSKITIPNSVKKEHIKIIDLESKKEIEAFSIRTKRLKSGLKNQIHVHEYNIPWPCNKEYLIKLPGSSFNCKIGVPKNDIMKYESSLRSDFNSTITSALRLNLGNTIICRLLHHALKIPAGKKSDIIYLPRIIKDSPVSVIRRAFEITFDCDGGVCGRTASLTSKSTRYLEDWQQVISKRFGIDSKVSKTGIRLKITGKKNFEKMFREFRFIQEKKHMGIAKNAGAKEILPPKTVNKFYLNVISELGGRATNTEIANESGKPFSTVKRYMPGLVKDGLVIKENSPKWGSHEKVIYKLVELYSSSERS